MQSTQRALKWTLFTVVVLLLALGSFALGFFISVNSNGTIDQKNVDASSLEGIVASSVSGQTRAPSNETSLTIADLTDPSKFESRIARTAALFRSLAGSSESTLRQFLEQSKSMHPGSWQSELQDAIIQRLSLLNPIVALTETRKFSEPRQQSLIPLVFREWAVSNLDQAIAHAQSFEDDQKRSVVKSIVLSRADLPARKLRDIASSLGHEWTAIKMLREHWGLVAIKNPKTELREFLNQNARSLDDLNEEQSALFAQILRAWLVQDGIEEFEEIEKALPQNYRLKQGTIFALGSNLAQESPDLALQLAVSARSVGLGGLAHYTVLRWAITDPVEALNAVSTLEGPSLRNSLQSRIMESWAARDPYELLHASRNMPVDVQAIGQEKALLAIAQSSPKRAGGLLVDIADMDARDRIASGIVSSWAGLDVDAALEWIENNESVSSKGDLREDTVISLVRINPHLAMEVANKLPPGEFGRGLEARAIGPSS